MYDFEDAIFHDIMDIKNNKVNIDSIKNVLKNAPYKNIKENTYCGLAKGIFDNDNEIVKELNAKTISEYFEIIKEQVIDYYKNN